MGGIGKHSSRIIDQDKQKPKKQRHTAKRIWQVLQKEGYTIVKDAVREINKAGKEVFTPLKHHPGEAQVDFGQAVFKMGGILRKIFFLVKAYDREYTETFWDGQVRAFEFFGGVARRLTYDNSKIAASKILGPRKRQLTDGFLQLVSHYLFKYHFCLVRGANEKGLVEGLFKLSRLNFLVPVARVGGFEELNTHLLQTCREDICRKL